MKEYLEKRIEELKKELIEAQTQYLNETDSIMSNYYYTKVLKLDACIWELRAALIMV